MMCARARERERVCVCVSEVSVVGQRCSVAKSGGRAAAWVISSAPLTLGYDLTDDNVTER